MRCLHSHKGRLGACSTRRIFGSPSAAEVERCLPGHPMLTCAGRQLRDVVPAQADVLVCARGGGGMLRDRMTLAAQLWAAGIRAEVQPLTCCCTLLPLTVARPGSGAACCLFWATDIAARSRQVQSHA